MSTVDVVIVAYNSRDCIRDCVLPLLELDWVNTIVVDNASPDRSGDAVADLPLTLVRAEENRGFGAGCNLGWRAGSSASVLFLNPDATISASGAPQCSNSRPRSNQRSASILFRSRSAIWALLFCEGGS